MAARESCNSERKAVSMQNTAAHARSFKLLLEGLLSDDGTDWILLHNCCRSAGGSRRVCQVDSDRLVRFLKDPLRFKWCWIEYICGGGIEDGY